MNPVAHESEVPPSDWLPEPPASQRPRPEPSGTPISRVLVVDTCVLLTGISLAWAFLSMRAVMGVGGSCGSGGPYEIATPCPDGAWLIAVAVPLMLIAGFVGTGVGGTIGAPALLLQMWALLFTLLGWNFWEFAFTDRVDVSLIVCGVLFWAMALPAWVFMFVEALKSVRARLPGAGQEDRAERDDREDGSVDDNPWWWLVYAVLYAGGGLLGIAVYAAAA